MSNLHLCARAALLAAAATAVAATSASAAPTKPVTLSFAAVNGQAPVACGAPITGLGTTQATASLQDLRFYVSDVKLLRAKGKPVPVRLAKDNASRVTRGGAGVTLIDLEDGTAGCAEEGSGATNAEVRGRVPAGRYTGARFTVGVPFALNHTNLVGAPAPLDSTAMGWSWQFGRKFAKIELADPSGTWPGRSFLIHLGATGCEGNPASGEAVSCERGNRAAISLKGFDPAKETIALDLAALTAGNDITVNQADAPGCMSGPTDPECGGVMKSFGLAWKSDGSGPGIPIGGQTAFRAITR